MEYNTVEYMYNKDQDYLGISIIRHKLYYNSIISSRGNYIDVNDDGIIESIDIKCASRQFGIESCLIYHIDDIEVLCYAINDDIMTLDITLKVLGKIYELKDYVSCESGISNKSICYTMV